MSSLEKIFIDKKPEKSDYQCASVLKGEEFAYQIAYYCSGFEKPGCNKLDLKLSLESPISECITVRKVVNVPSELPVYEGLYDENFIRTEPGLFPDLLEEITEANLDASLRYHAIWIEIKTNKDMLPGNYPITITLADSKNKLSESKTFYLEVIDAQLPEQKLIFTQWFHADCIAKYYNVDAFSEEHWVLLEKFIKTAADNGVNMILTPIFTPPLDTMVGGERPTVQLVDIYKDRGKYTFGFDKLKRWVDLCHKCGIKYFEMAHLFTQWGAKFTPKIMAYENGELKRIFGWDVEATSDKYKRFLEQFLPTLIAFLKKEGIDEKTYFHISDEPTEEHQESYAAAKSVIGDMLNDFVVFDALSNYEFYEKGLVKKPVPANDHIEPFLENNVPNLWTYYYCGPYEGVSNRFMSMPSYRNRILGIQMYKYDIVGFLHWGYNFYYSQFSKQLINPFVTTDALCAFPSGDAFSVYPGEDGPMESLRLKVFKHGLQDMQAFKCLENIIGKDDVVALIDSEIAITFKDYPRNSDYILNLREKINGIIKMCTNGADLKQLKKELSEALNNETDQRMLSKDERTDNQRYIKIIEEIKKVIDEEYATITNVAQITDGLGISSHHANKIFKALNTITIFDYLVKVRIEKAKELLEDPYCKIYEVAGKVGYESTAYFTTIFKRHVGVTPNNYREQHRHLKSDDNS